MKIEISGTRDPRPEGVGGLARSVSWNANDGMAVTGCIAAMVAIGTFLRLLYMLQR